MCGKWSRSSPWILEREQTPRHLPETQRGQPGFLMRILGVPWRGYRPGIETKEGLEGVTEAEMVAGTEDAGLVKRFTLLCRIRPFA